MEGLNVVSYAQPYGASHAALQLPAARKAHLLSAVVTAPQVSIACPRGQFSAPAYCDPDAYCLKSVTAAPEEQQQQPGSQLLEQLQVRLLTPHKLQTAPALLPKPRGARPQPNTSRVMPFALQDCNACAQRLLTLLSIHREQVRRLAPCVCVCFPSQRPVPPPAAAVTSISSNATPFFLFAGHSLTCSRPRQAVLGGLGMPRAGAASCRCSQAAAADCVIPAQQVGLAASTQRTHSCTLAAQRWQQVRVHSSAGQSLHDTQPEHLHSSCCCRSCFCKLLERLHLLDALWKASNPGPTPGAQADAQLGPAEIMPDASQVSSTVIIIAACSACVAASMPGW
jgi:hypothetical protein